LRFAVQLLLNYRRTSVITGSYNFSRSAQFNAENILFIESAPLAEAYSVYIDHLKQKYRP
jgi:phosphatidylserine/phosphatidylglycerophosphate/cardiolipin synthase-like enzyme